MGPISLSITSADLTLHPPTQKLLLWSYEWPWKFHQDLFTHQKLLYFLSSKDRQKHTHTSIFHKQMGIFK